MTARPVANTKFAPAEVCVCVWCLCALVEVSFPDIMSVSDVFSPATMALAVHLNPHREAAKTPVRRQPRLLAVGSGVVVLSLARGCKRVHCRARCTTLLLQGSSAGSGQTHN